MRIGIDLACWSNRRGYGRYTRCLVEAMVSRDRAHTFVGFADPETLAEGVFPAGLTLTPVHQSEAPARAAHAYGRRRLLDLWRMSRAVQRAHLDLMFFPSTYSYFPVLGRARCVVVAHDAIAERWPHLIFPTLAGRLAWGAKSRLACWQAQRVVTVSASAAEAIHRRLGVPRERLRVVHEAADPVFAMRDTPADRRERARVLERYGVPPDAHVLLYVGGFSPHKNLETLLEALAELVSDGRDEDRAPAARPALHLVMAGETTGEVFYSCYGALVEQVRRLRLERHVTLPGYVPDGDLAHLYQAAMCLVLPSWDEGFGLPLVEAMACGAPVVAARAGAVPEVVGDAGLLVDPGAPADLARAIRSLVTQPALRAELRQRGLGRAAALSWEKTAEGVLAVFDELAPRAGGSRANPRRAREQHA